MNTRIIIVLTAVAVLEGVAIIALFLQPKHIAVSVIQEAATVKDPFFWALKYNAPDSKFKQLVQEYPKWISYRDPASGWSALPECAALKRTNVARILIANGADLASVIMEEKKMHNMEVVDFLEGIQNSLRHDKPVEHKR